MKRREFIGLLGASALSMPFILGERSLGFGGNKIRPTAAKNKIPMALKLPKDVTEVTSLLGESSKGVYLLGGTAIAAVAKVESQYLNILVDTEKLSDLKKALFEFGVAPVSTADLPANFVRFVYQDKAYNVLNMNFDTYLQMSMQESGLILFSHNFALFSVKDKFMLDPYDALGSKVNGEKSFYIKPLQQPKTLVQGFEHCLAATFDRALLGLKPSVEYSQLEERVFESTPGAADSKGIFSRVLDYTPDILEVAGFDAAARLLTAPVSVKAGKTAAEIDFIKVERGLRQLREKNSSVTGSDFMVSVHTELKKKPTGEGAAQGLPEFIMNNKQQFRRVDVLLEAMESANA
jgi:hypothetical protein